MEDDVTKEAVKIRESQPTEPLPQRAPASEARAFPAGPRADRYFASDGAERARLAIVRCVERMDGPALLIGPSGSGKSLMLAVLAESFRFRLSVATLPGGLLRTPRELHQGVLYALGLPFRGLDEGELRLSLLQRLEADDDPQGGVLLLVDEAQSLSLELMEELRMLTNVVREGASQVRLVMAGTPVLEEQLTDPRLESFDQRVAVRCYLRTMSRAETSSYVQAHLSAARRDPGLFTPDAIDEIYEVSEGLPRLVNQVADLAMVRAQAEGRKAIDAAVVREAWSELQQLPAAPTTGDPQHDDAGSEDVIEFGAWQDPLDAGQPQEGPDHRPTSGEVDRDDASSDYGNALGVLPADPDEQLQAITEQIESIQESDSAAGGDERLSPDVSDVDFSLPNEEWPEVEVVVRGGPRPRVGDYREEEVISDPFQVAPHRSGWSITTDGYPGDPGRDLIRLAVEANLLPADLEPLSGVPLMVQVQTELYTPDPVLPDEAPAQIAIAISADVVSEGDAPSRGGPAASTAPKHPAPPPAKRKFATLFSTLQG